ncbi:MAG: AAA family ATPase [Stenotrophomonas sp.]
MPTIEKLSIRNFKGIESVDLDLEGKSTSPVVTLIGLNESGKTTILEALSHFITGNRSVASLFDSPHSKATGLGLIPMHKKAAYSGRIEISAEVSLSDADIRDIERLAASKGIKLRSELLKNIIATKRFEYEDSTLKDSRNYWTFDLFTKKGKATKFTRYKRPEEPGKYDFWLDIVNGIQRKMPQVSYFPTFLVDMPQKIYLQEHDGESALNRHYRFAFQDILDSLEDKLSIEKHVVQRIKDYKEAQNASPSWLSTLLGSPSKSPIDSVFQRISSAVTKEVLGSWHRIFQRAVSIKAISIDWGVDAENGDIPYATFHVTDGESKFAINERSLGFRWFFSFLLFTGFNRGKERKTIFAFDEPAANLHAKAQAELLASFSKIASSGNKIIYSTHSHHMINPRWLGSAYIVENSALDYDGEDSFGLDSNPTNISATAYRNFVSKYPSRSSYFQPVIEKLEYVAPDIVGTGPYLIVEGITDFYALSIAYSTEKNRRFSIIPGTGSGAAGPLVSQLMGQGVRFSILLDDDKEGKKSALKYEQEWYLTQAQVLTLSHVAGEFTGMAIEKLLGSETEKLISKKMLLTKQPTKRQVGWYLAEAFASGEGEKSLPDEALCRLRVLTSFFHNRFASEAS